MSAEDILHAQDWSKILTQLTAYAFKRIRQRSMLDAEDIAQTAIAEAFRSVDRGGYDPSKGTLMGYLTAHVGSLTFNEHRRKRNRCEVWLDEELEDTLAKDEPLPDEALDRLRYAAAFRDHLFARVKDDELCTSLALLMMEGIATPTDLAAAAGRDDIDEIRDARRRLRYHAVEITKELSATMPEGEDEVTP